MEVGTSAGGIKWMLLGSVATGAGCTTSSDVSARTEACMFLDRGADEVDDEVNN
jgi:hypothetical protein